MNDLEQKLKDEALKLLGAPYKYGADLSEAPNFFDCSSFTQHLYKQISVEIPRSSILQASEGTLVADFSEGVGVLDASKADELLKIGDLLFVRGVRGFYRDELFSGKRHYIGHVAMYIGDGKIIHASSSRGVVVQELAEFQNISPDYKIMLVKRYL